ncbi:hypothetical protein [Pseudooceanicola sp. 200-1SW]|uniref:hypothetical protein n=1 Tax=Pseudooceanicola sp. 200-1SW TaxID=3425949 RepID=UPI003D7FFFDE
MSRTKKPPITDKITGLRQRQRADGSWRIWWEPSGPQRDLGFCSIELDVDRPSWSVTQAKREAEKARRALRDGVGPEETRRGQRTVGALAAGYRQDELPQVKPATQRSYRGWLKVIEEKWGDELVGDLTHGVMYRWGKSLQRERGVTQAKRLIAMMSILMSYAERIEWRAHNTNPCLRLGLEVPAARNRVVTTDELAALEAAAEAIDTDRARAVADAMRLSLFQGQRQADVLAARVGAFRQVTWPALEGDRVVERRGWAWIFTRAKRATEGGMPVHPENLALIERRHRETNDPDALLLPGRTGLWRVDEFQKDWAALRKRATEILESCATIQFRDLRRTGAVWARQGGASKSDVGDVLGNTAAQNAQLTTTYMPASFETSSRAIGAIRRPGREEDEG